MESNDAVKKTLLQELDSLNDRDDVLVVATCNDIDVLGEALLRAGRFDRKIHIDLPDTNTRKLILEEYLGRMKIDYDFDIQYVAQYTQSYTGAKLESLINEAGIIAMQKENHVINIDDIKAIMRKFVFDGDEKNAFDDMEDLRKVAVHEAGHAIVAMLLTPDNIHGASVLPQGDSNGHISFVRTESNVISIEDIEHEITVFLAGRVAERMIFNKNFTGSASDIAKATSSLYFLIVECAAYGYDGAVFTVRTPYRKEFYSEQAKTDVNNLVKDKLEEFERFAELLIGKAYPAFEAIVGYLMEKHTLTRDELFEILMNYGLDQSVA
jgi:cell division protease FtsH